MTEKSKMQSFVHKTSGARGEGGLLLLGREKKTGEKKKVHFWLKLMIRYLQFTFDKSRNLNTSILAVEIQVFHCTRQESVVHGLPLDFHNWLSPFALRAPLEEKKNFQKTEKYCCEAAPNLPANPHLAYSRKKIFQHESDFTIVPIKL